MTGTDHVVSACIHLNQLSGSFLNYYYIQNKTDDDIKTMKTLINCIETVFKEFIEESEKFRT